ncbi:sugar-transfer associated ATP-grasp domain-containing protein [uncultured Algibacter sp.]|uniref:sugar-transfer associated ATP-grasp domain-containing protein n=1 Tax=uncultured Algibacter sp. TaxID=298659 RepID=UPI002612F890|nr:sugar-transfer associated ATP-grasp domain-containing protein [uncultured Algibacter sp.]
MIKKDTKDNIRWHFRLKRSNKKALNALKIIEDYKGEINPKLVKLSNEYAKEVLGSKAYAPWLYVYAALQNKFEEGWIPDNYYNKEVVQRQKGEYGELADRNFITPLLFPKMETLNVGYFINGKFCTTDNKIINPENFKDYIFKKNSKLVYKLENSKRGKGVFVMDRNNFNTSFCLSCKNDNGVFQKFIEQHPFFLEFTDNAVATIRITTVSNEIGNISAKASFIKMGRNNDTHVMSSSAINIPINIKTGELSSKAYMNWKELDSHPDSKVTFEGKKIPHFEKCIEKGIQMHSEIPFIGCIGWDFAIDKFEEVQLIEWNGRHNGIKFSEATTGPCFKGLNWENLWKQK